MIFENRLDTILNDIQVRTVSKIQLILYLLFCNLDIYRWAPLCFFYIHLSTSPYRSLSTTATWKHEQLKNKQITWFAFDI